MNLTSPKRNDVSRAKQVCRSFMKSFYHVCGYSKLNHVFCVDINISQFIDVCSCIHVTCTLHYRRGRERVSLRGEIVRRLGSIPEKLKNSKKRTFETEVSNS